MAEVSGFTLKVFLDESLHVFPSKCIVFVDLSKCRKVKDVQEHIKDVLCLKSNIYLMKDGFYLPPNESVILVRPFDSVTACPAENQSPGSAGTQDQRRNGTSRHKSRDFDDIEADPVESIVEQKKQELLAKISLLSANQDEDSTENKFETPNSESGVEMKRRRRLRKRKKKTSERGDDVSNTEESFSVQAPPIKTVKTELSKRNHIRFSDEELEISHVDEPEPQKPEDPIENGHANLTSDWKAALLTLASKSLDQKTFDRKSKNTWQIEATASCSKSREASSVQKLSDVSQVSSGEIIEFKVLVIGADCCPTAETVRCQVVSNKIELKILECVVLDGQDHLSEYIENGLAQVPWDCVREPATIST